MHQRHSFFRNAGLGAFTLCALLLAGCKNKPITVDAPPPTMEQSAAAEPLGDSPENMLDWDGTYQSILPCTNCQAIAISVQLRPDKTAMVRERQLGVRGAKPVVTYSGPFRFRPAGGSMIEMRHNPSSPVVYRFFVGENWIELRDLTTGAALSSSPAFYLPKTSTEE